MGTPPPPPPEVFAALRSCDELYVLVPFWAHSAGTLITAETSWGAFNLLAESVHPLALGNVKRSVEQIWQLAKKLVRLHTPDADEAALSALVTRLTTELYSHSHLITRAEATALGLPVEQPSDHLEDRLLAYYDQLKANLELLEKFDPQGDLPVVLERAYIETPSTCDAFVSRGVANECWEPVA